MIQPSDIKEQKFKKGILGYKSSEVDSFVNTVYRAYDELFKENEKLADELEKVNNNLKDCRLKVFELENQVSKSENVSSYGEDEAEAKKKADKIIKNAEAAAAEIIAKAKEQSKDIESGAAKAEAPKQEASSGFKIKGAADTKKSAPAKEETASSKFFQKGSESTTAKVEDDDDEIFVGEIEDARKPDRMMIGDGEEEEDLDFEFL